TIESCSVSMRRPSSERASTFPHLPRSTSRLNDRHGPHHFAPKYQRVVFAGGSTGASAAGFTAGDGAGDSPPATGPGRGAAALAAGLPIPPATARAVSLHPA